LLRPRPAMGRAKPLKFTFRHDSRGKTPKRIAIAIADMMKTGRHRDGDFARKINPVHYARLRVRDFTMGLVGVAAGAGPRVLCLYADDGVRPEDNFWRLFEPGVRRENSRRPVRHGSETGEAHGRCFSARRTRSRSDEFARRSRSTTGGQIAGLVATYVKGLGGRNPLATHPTTLYMRIEK